MSLFSFLSLQLPRDVQMELETQCRGESSLSLSLSIWKEVEPFPQTIPISSLSTFFFNWDGYNALSLSLCRDSFRSSSFASRSYADKPSVPMALLLPHSRQSKTIALCTAHSAKHIVIWVCLCPLMFHVTERGICCAGNFLGDSSTVLSDPGVHCLRFR